MRPDQHKQKRSAQYKKKHGIQDKGGTKKDGERGGAEGGRGRGGRQGGGQERQAQEGSPAARGLAAQPADEVSLSSKVQFPCRNLDF